MGARGGAALPAGRAGCCWHHRHHSHRRILAAAAAAAARVAGATAGMPAEQRLAAGFPARDVLVVRWLRQLLRTSTRRLFTSQLKASTNCKVRGPAFMHLNYR